VGVHFHSYIWKVRSIRDLPTSFGHGTVLLAVHILLLPAAISSTTTVLILLVLAIIGVIVVRRWAISRSAARAAGATPAPDELEPELAKRLFDESEQPHVEERFRTPHDQVENYAIVLLDIKGRPTSWNAGIRRVLGYEKAEFLQTTAADLYPIDDRQSGAPAADLAEAARRGQFTNDRWLLRKDGSRFWGSVSTTSVHDGEGRLLGFARRLRDLSEGKAVEEQLRRKQEALELALEAAELGTWEHDFSTGDDFMDARARALFGMSADEPVTRARLLEAIHPDDRERTRERWKGAVNERERYSAEYRVVWPDGGVHWIMAVGRCVTDPTTEAPLHIAGVVLDLTERRRTEEQLQEGLRLEAVGRLAGGIAHDLNNMLAAILGFSDLLGRSFEPDDLRASDVEQISRAASRSADLTRQLLAFARRELIQPRALDINAVIQHVQAMLPPILGENVELDLRLAPDLGVVYADARQIEHMVMNLVLNARDAMPQGGRVTIETRAVQLGPGLGTWRSEEERALSGRFTVLSVADNGHGMNAATLQRIWEPFFTTKPPGRGTGLGLASVYGAAKQSGGFVWADSEPGRGTTVQVYWPEIRAAAELPAEPEPMPPLAGGNETLLIVEDEDLVRALAVRVLRSFGYTCHQAREASEALRLLDDQETRVDLLVTDVVMPGMSGRELGNRLVRLRPGTPVLYTSGFTDEDVIRRGMLEHGRPFLQKPFTPHQLARAVREALDAAAVGRAAAVESP
jgi:two-component system cell cycle sensor histidine kinase/response regulator CckA